MSDRINSRILYNTRENLHQEAENMRQMFALVAKRAHLLKCKSLLKLTSNMLFIYTQTQNVSNLDDYDNCLLSNFFNFMKMKM